MAIKIGEKRRGYDGRIYEAIAADALNPRQILIDYDGNDPKAPGYADVRDWEQWEVIEETSRWARFSYKELKELEQSLHITDMVAATFPLGDSEKNMLEEIEAEMKSRKKGE